VSGPYTQASSESTDKKLARWLPVENKKWDGRIYVGKESAGLKIRLWGYFQVKLVT